MTALAAGTRLGPYEILAPIGAGGMGEVYRARDTRLGREVAIKISAERFSERFEREARAVAALNHPNICTLYDVGPNYLVMEYIEGESPKGPTSLEETLKIARQIADALEAAHEKGIVHRDLKPGNIKIKPDGTVKVLDFGLAKVAATEAADSDHSLTFTMGATQAGMILGTAAYMAPEQARGKPIDKRADIWAFGVVLYEMLTGRRLFEGETVSDTLAAVLTKDPDLSSAPVKVRRLLARCLEKDPKRRLHDIADAWLLLDEAPSLPASKTRFLWMVAAASVIAVASLLQPWIFRRSVEPIPQPLVRLEVDLGADVSLASIAGAQAILSPDGSRLVYCSQSRLFTRRLDDTKAVELPGTEAASVPFFSPDGQWVGFFTPGELKKVSVQSGTAITLCPASNTFGASWGEDGNIVAAFGRVLFRVPSGGGKLRPLTTLAPGERVHRWPQVLPVGKGVLFTASSDIFGVEGARIDVITPAGQRKTVTRGAWARYLPSGHLVYVDSGTLFAAPFDLDKLDIRGTPVPVLTDFAYNTAFGSALLDISGTASGSGTAVYQARGAGIGMTSVQWLDAAGRTRPLIAKPGDYLNPRLSADGNRVALVSAGEIWVYDSSRDTMARLTVDGGHGNPVWSPDGRFIVSGVREGMSWTRADTAGESKLLTRSGNTQFPFSWSTDGKRLAFMENDLQTGGFDIWSLPVESDGAGIRAGKPEVFLQTPFDERHPSFSPDGRWLAYSSNESGAFQIYVRAYPSGGRKRQVSSAGGVYPAWSRRGSELFFRTMDNKIMSAAYTLRGDSFVPEKPRVWSEKRLTNVGLLSSYDVAPDGRGVAALMPVEGPDAQNAQNHVVFLLNFFDELRRRVPMVSK